MIVETYLPSHKRKFWNGYSYVSPQRSKASLWLKAEMWDLSTFEILWPINNNLWPSPVFTYFHGIRNGTKKKRTNNKNSNIWCELCFFLLAVFVLTRLLDDQWILIINIDVVVDNPPRGCHCSEMGNVRDCDIVVSEFEHVTLLRLVWFSFMAYWPLYDIKC